MNLLNSCQPVLAFLIACSAKATALLLLTWGLAAALRGQSAAVRHRTWAAGILCTLALPALTPVLPAWHSTALGGAAALWSSAKIMGTKADFGSLPAMVVNASAAAPLLSKLAGIVVLVWMLGSLVFALRLACGLAQLARLSKRARLLSQDDRLADVDEFCDAPKITRRVRVLQSGNPLAMPLTWGIFRPVVILPPSAREWPENRRRIVLFHEFAHIARHDCFLQMCAELARSFYWFHPLAWMAAGKLRQESERACDDAVLNSGIAAPEYANQLLDLARTLEKPDRRWSAALAVARASTLERRFTAMLNPSIKRSEISRKTGLFTTIAALCLVLPLAAVRLPGQDLSGSFGGLLQDRSGAGVRNATVIMVNRHSESVSMTASDAGGNFRFKGLAAGAYEMKVMKRGFETYRVPQVTLEPGGELSQNITLEVAAVMEEVDVVPQGTVKPLPGSETGGKPSRLRLGGDVQATKLSKKVMPVYPAGAKAAGIEGKVILHAVIGKDGKPLSLRVMNDQVDPELARAALESVSQWRYRPTLLNDERIEVDTTIMVNFSLER
jgi:TonB family protein